MFTLVTGYLLCFILLACSDLEAEEDSGVSLSLTTIVVSCVFCYIFGVVTTCLPSTLLYLCVCLKGKGGRWRERERGVDSPYIEGKSVTECPVYEDIPAQYVNRTHFECDENQAYGQAATCRL